MDTIVRELNGSNDTLPYLVAALTCIEGDFATEIKGVKGMMFLKKAENNRKRVCGSFHVWHAQPENDDPFVARMMLSAEQHVDPILRMMGRSVEQFFKDHALVCVCVADPFIVTIPYADPWGELPQMEKPVRELMSMMNTRGKVHDDPRVMASYDKAMLAEQACAACGKDVPRDGKHLCGGDCGMVRYCNTDCAKSHWPHHKQACAHYKKNRKS